MPKRKSSRPLPEGVRPLLAKPENVEFEPTEAASDDDEDMAGQEAIDAYEAERDEVQLISFDHDDHNYARK